MIQSNYYPNLVVLSNLFILCTQSSSIRTVGETGEDMKVKRRKERKKREGSKRKDLKFRY